MLKEESIEEFSTTNLDGFIQSGLVPHINSLFSLFYQSGIVDATPLPSKSIISPAVRISSFWWLTAYSLSRNRLLAKGVASSKVIFLFGEQSVPNDCLI